MANEFNRSNIPELETTFFNKEYVDDLLLATQMVQFCMGPESQGSNKGDVVRFQHYNEWTKDVTVLSETSTTDNKLSQSGLVDSTNATLNPYGTYLEISEFTLATAPETALAKISQRAVDAGAAAIDQLVYDVAQTSTVVMYAGQVAVATSGAPSISVAADFNYMAAKFGTVGAHGFKHLGGKFGGVLHPNAAAHLKGQAQGSTAIPTWVAVNQHVIGAQEKIMTGSLGALFSVALFESPVVEQVNGEDYENMVLALGGLGISEIDGQGQAKARVIVKKPGPNDTFQPLDTYETVGWKWMGAAAQLDDDRVIKYWSSQA